MALDSTPKLPTTGTEVTFAMLVGGNPILETKTQWLDGTVTEVAQQYRDKLMGRKRDRVDKKTTGFDFNPSFLVADMTVVEAIRGVQAQVESYQATDDLSFSFEFQLRDGTQYGFVLVRSTAKFTLGMSGKDERNKITLAVESEDWVTV